MEEKLKLENLIKVANDEKLSMDERRKAVEALNKIVPHYNATIDQTTRKFKASDKALKAYINSLVRLYEVQAPRSRSRSLPRSVPDSPSSSTRRRAVWQMPIMPAASNIPPHGELPAIRRWMPSLISSQK